MAIVKIPLAYCFETNEITPADLAVHKRDQDRDDHHYSCVSRNCGHPLDEAHRHETGVAWFRSKAVTATDNHVVTCPYRSGSGSSDASEQTKPYRPDSAVRFVVPTVLGQSPKGIVRQWPSHSPPSREELAALAAKAKRAEIYGNLEDVVNAYETIVGERPSYSLDIKGNKTNYKDAFQWIWKLPQPWSTEHWGTKIIRIDCSVNPGRVNGFWFLNAWSPKDEAKDPIKVSLMLRSRDFAYDAHKADLLALLETASANKGQVKLFWQGNAPERNDKGYILSSGMTPLHTCFAIRPRPK